MKTHNLSEEEYRVIPGYRSSQLKTVHSGSLKHAKHDAEKPRERKTCFDFGTALHMTVLTPEMVDKYVIVQPNFSGTKGEKQPWISEQMELGRSIVTQGELDHIHFVGDAIREDKLAMSFIENCDREVLKTWQEPVTGVECKARLDLYREGEFVVDLKSTKSCNPQFWKYDAYNYGYHIQAVHYKEPIEIEFSKEVPFYFVVVEVTAPYDVVVFEADIEMIRDGIIDRMCALEKIAEAQITDQWPGYGQGKIQPVGKKPWRA